MRRIVILVLLAVGACGPGGSPDGPESGTTLAVAAAADLRFAMERLIAAFRTGRPGLRVNVSYGSSGNFYAQLRAGAPFDLFFSADALYPRRLEQEGLVRAGSFFLYGIGRIVIWCPASSPLDTGALGAAVLDHPSIRHIAIANPQHAPYGQAAEAALRSLGLYERVKPKLVLGDNISQTLQFVQSGAADIGIVALSLALAPEVKAGGRYWEIPLDSYPRMDQAGVILRRAANPEAAEALRAFTLSAEGRRILGEFGFLSVEAD